MDSNAAIVPWTDYVGDCVCVNKGKNKSEQQIKEFTNGNLCRCGAYNGIVESIEKLQTYETFTN
ncbi:2Fe-2S iron-sulfur cluster-binding protein [Faecalibacter sp. LW9]|uniref:2Fe-2S iron-sulfur cluster-binding protein n=1 Tax=Faecalibacter sp. LW9 TaxID=3103144 RepID=UPI002AFE7CEA|nr:2Fe-2S iron-sulfur cluster-binding protein [Faecalibacter sp. LW9]